MTKVIIVVQNGLVESVYARNKDVEVGLLDMDAQDPDELKKREKRLAAVEKSKSYRNIL